ncbi:ATPase-P-type: HAD ATPase, P-type, family IC [Gaiella occulta]|uniref:ATPase-P-type: HAD ATPase, P-type, family IC n=1 Tax=Gaiella occulta TaxID=1002870 RepID=A0A7M2YZN0_9ACTN|nr:HAD-IC family P-type ATPase [Gaiella occulta]RDI75598.1 ATPase-P-type: HAD ATPase, P-type, family IC [Gaiella occulta]
MRAGLTEAEARRRLDARGAAPEIETSRSTASTVRANVVTPFNAILLSLGLLTLVFGDWRDALFLGIVVSNSAIGIWQELRAKRKLDELAALVAPRATVVRGGEARALALAEIVEGDLVRLAPGDQVVADGPLVEAAGLHLDESILTGESRPVARAVGDEALSGSFVVEGSGAMEVAAVGADSHAGRIAGTAREFRHPRSPLERSINRLLYVLLGVMVPLGGMLVVVLWKQDVGVRHAVDTSVAGMVTLVPEGLVLLVSVTYAAAALRLARAGALAQQLNAIESLASVDTICIDKTGTLTESRLRVVALAPVEGTAEQELAHALARFAASFDPRNPTLDAVAAAVPAPAEPADEAIPFLSRRRWSGLRIGGTRYVLGAPELFPLGALTAVAGEQQEAGRRVVAFGVAAAAFPADPDEGPPPLRPLGIVVLAEDLRRDARATVAFFLKQGVEVKVLSGDAPRTVGAIARDAGIPMHGEAIDGSSLPDEAAELAAVARDAAVVGRVSPEGKRRIVESLRAQGRYVAMVGDGVNDVPALKAARLAVAQASGAQMAKAVADVVLVSGDFAALPGMVAEGRRILRNIQRVTKLFVAKSVFAAFLIVAIGITPAAYPLLPRHLTIAAALTVGIPAFFLALAPSEGPWHTGRFLREVSRFSVPAGVAAGLGVTTTYLVSSNVFDLGLLQSRTAATSTLIVVGLYLVLALEATSTKRARLVGLLCALLLAAYVAVIALPGLRTFFELAVPNAAATTLVVIGSAVAIGFLWLTDERFVPLSRGSAA